MARDSDNKARAVADLSHLSDHYRPMPTKNETLEGFSANLLPKDYLITMDLRSGYNHFRLHKDMRKFFVVSVLLADGSVRYFRYLVLPFGWTRSGYWFCRLVGRFWTKVKKHRGYRVCSYVDDFAVAPSMGRHSTQGDCIKASRYLDGHLLRYGLTRHSTKGVWGSGSQVVQHLGFVIDTVRGTFEVPAAKLDKIEMGARRLLRMAQCKSRRVPMKELSSFIGRAQSLRLAVPDTAFRLRASYVSLYGKEGTEDGPGSWARSKTRDRGSHGPRQRVVLSHPEIKDLQYWRDLKKSMHHRPIWPTVKQPTTTVHTDASLTAYGATLRKRDHGPGTMSHFETQGYWEGSHRKLAHITILELLTVRLTLETFIEHCLIQQAEIVKLYTDNMVVMYTVSAMVSRSPLIMAELRRLYDFLKQEGLELQLHHLPSALNLYADRLSRRRRLLDYLPRLPTVPEHWWEGDSEHDMKASLAFTEYLRPPLELSPLVARKIRADKFSGLLIMPRWEKQNWH